MDRYTANHNPGNPHGLKLAHSRCEVLQQQVLGPIQETLSPVWNCGIGDQIYDGRFLLWPACGFLINSAKKLSRSQRTHSTQNAPDFIFVTRVARVFDNAHDFCAEDFY